MSESGEWWSAFAGQLSEPLTRVEEDWELIISQPDPAITAPQLGTVMTPFESTERFYLELVLNHRPNPSWQPGGMELHAFYKGELLNWFNAGYSALAQNGEKVRWTQRMEIEDGFLRFEVLNGESSTWGPFGVANPLRVQLPTTLVHLKSYDPTVSAVNSGIDYGAHKVKKLHIRTVRGYSSSGGLLFENRKPIVVFGR